MKEIRGVVMAANGGIEDVGGAGEEDNTEWII